MLLKVEKAKHINEYKLELLFNNGSKGIVDLKDNLDGAVFSPLKQIDYFKQFTKNRWTPKLAQAIINTSAGSSF